MESMVKRQDIERETITTAAFIKQPNKGCFVVVEETTPPFGHPSFAKRGILVTKSPASMKKQGFIIFIRLSCLTPDSCLLTPDSRFRSRSAEIHRETFKTFTLINTAMGLFELI